ncbi:hypothetical protein CY34DRAFT_18157 [Suillus luteus UH-Slu-Lm8-n1]|uniref:Uncharacterized protein n=1 Tax=Suillus luteus UH-Slu-Lm8-n1 TaxID=930992 RepID=A0A0C9Z8D4_9AGAM|nr:hypothetical protein CY34DRAFT_18157 [Suillus luteus UH-Slu-Lm8-n1]
MSINQMRSNSGSILRGMQHESIATTSESFQESAHPDDVAAMLTEWAQACKEDQYIRAHQWSPAALQHLQDTQPVFPIPNQFTAPVPSLPQYPQMDTSQYHSTLEGPSWSHPAQGTSTASEMDHSGYATSANALLSPASDPDATMTLSDGDDLEASSPASNETMHASGSSRVLRPRPTVESENSSSAGSSRVLRPRPAVKSENSSSVSSRVLRPRPVPKSRQN